MGKDCRTNWQPGAGVLMHEPTPEPHSEEKCCALCGAPTTFACSLCMETFYCGEEHQTIHWEQGHMHDCGKTKPAVPEAAAIAGIEDGKGSQLGAIPRAPQFLLSRRDSFRIEGIEACV